MNSKGIKPLESCWHSEHRTPLGKARSTWLGKRIRSIRIQDNGGFDSDFEATGMNGQTLTPSQARLSLHLTRALEKFFDAKKNPIEWDWFDLEDRTEFQKGVLLACFQIPLGETRSYRQLAELAGSPLAARAVGSVMASNRIPLLIPCHRVLGSGKSFGGYSAPGGLDTKRWLLDRESDSRVHA